MPDLPYDAVLLDLDGTLSAAGPAITAAVSVALAHLGHEPFDEDALLAFVGPPLEHSLAALGHDDALVTEAVAVYRAHYDLLGPPLYDGVRELLDALTGAGLRLALATSKPELLAEEILLDKGIAGSFTAICGSGPDGTRPTKADVVAHALAQLPGARRPVMVGDRSYDVLGAAAHGVPCIGAVWGYGTPAELTGAGAVALAESPAALQALLLP